MYTVHMELMDTSPTGYRYTVPVGFLGNDDDAISDRLNSEYI